MANVRNLRVSGMPVETEDPVSPAKKRLIYALGTIGYDFGTESRRDTFQQLMPPVEVGGRTVPANPYDPRQMSDHLARNPSEARSLVWTLHQEQTPVYALKPVGPFGHQLYETLRLLLSGQVDASGGGAFVERVSVPAERTERAIRLFSGQVVPMVKLRVSRGLYGWQVDHVIEDALAAAASDLSGDEAARVRRRVAGLPGPGLPRPEEPRGHLEGPGLELRRHQRLPGRRGVRQGRRRGPTAQEHRGGQEPGLPPPQRLLGREAEVLRPR